MQGSVATDDHDGVDAGLERLGELFAGVLGVVALDAGGLVPERAQQLLGVVGDALALSLAGDGLTTSATCIPAAYGSVERESRRRRSRPASPWLRLRSLSQAMSSETRYKAVIGTARNNIVSGSVLGVAMAENTKIPMIVHDRAAAS